MKFPACSEQSNRRIDARDWLIALSLATAVAIVYFPTCNFDFVNFDDAQYVFNNLHVFSGLNLVNVEWAFSTFEMGSWHPLTWLTLQLDVELWGTSATGFHVVNFLLLHARSTRPCSTWC